MMHHSRNKDVCCRPMVTLACCIVRSLGLRVRSKLMQWLPEKFMLDTISLYQPCVLGRYVAPLRMFMYPTYRHPNRSVIHLPALLLRPTTQASLSTPGQPGLVTKLLVCASF